MEAYCIWENQVYSMLAIEERFKYVGTAEKYLDAAKAAMNFINTRKRTDEEGIYWTLADAAAGKPSYYDEICMYAGASGIICFLLSLYEDTQDAAYLDEAKEAGCYLEYRWRKRRELKRNFSPYAFSTGWGGASFALLQMYLVTKILDQAVRDAIPVKEGEGYYWSTYPGIVGTAGTILVILNAAEKLGREDWKEFAVKAGRYFLTRGRDMGNGMICYTGVDPTYFGAGKDYIDPNFPMGTGGIGFLMLKLYEVSGKKEFLDAVKGVPEYMDTVAVKMRAGKLLPHALPDRPDLFYLGYCHGPAGPTRFYYELYKFSGDAKYRHEIEELVKGLEATGAPEKRSAGYWNTENICCGTAGLLNMYLGLWAAFGEEHDLEYARRCAKVLMDTAVFEDGVDGGQASWKFALDRVAPERLSTPIGFLDGAAGIGSVLLQMARAERGDFHTVRAVDDPFPERKLEK